MADHTRPAASSRQFTPEERTWIVTVEGYEPMEYVAATAAKARWKCYRAFTEAFGRGRSFRNFLTISQVSAGTDANDSHAALQRARDKVAGMKKE